MNKVKQAGRRFLGLVLLVSAIVAAAQVGQGTAEVERVLGSALGPSPLEENLRVLTDEIGGRVSTSQRMQRAAAWAVKAFRAAGVDAVRTESFTMPSSWAEVESHLEVFAPATQPVDIVSIGWSPSTAPAGLEASIVDAGTGTEEDFARLGNRARSALLLIHTPVLQSWDDLFAEYVIVEQALPRAKQAGAAGVLWMSSREKKLLYRRPTGLAGEIGELPQAIVAREDALRIARLLAAGREVRARLTLVNRIGGPTAAQNVVAEIRGAEKPEEVVILGAHLDSWDLGTGALDDGCNSTLVIDVARALRAAGRPPRRTVRFILFSGEEQGMVGSAAYVAAHREEMDNIVAVVIYDEGIGRIKGYSLGGRAELEGVLRGILAPVEAWGSNEHTSDAFVGTDNFDFVLEGIPTLVAAQEEYNYLENYHAASDTFDKVDIRELKLHSAYAAATVWGLADRAQRFGQRQSRAEIEALMKQTGLDTQMQGLGIWEQWTRGERGRGPN